MGERNRLFPFICFLFLTLESAYCIVDYCRNHTFDRATNNDVLHFSKENSDREFGIYDKFKCLHCCAHGYRSIEWFKDGQPYPWPTDISTLILHPESRNQTIYTQQLTAADSGKYWCFARNGTHSIKHEVLLQISGPSISMGWPKTMYKPRDQKVKEGELVRFYCEAFVGTIDLPDFESEVFWEKHDGNRSFIDGERIRQEKIFREEKRVIGSYLIFNQVRSEDYGRYTCKVKNLGDQVIELNAWLSSKLDRGTPWYFNRKNDLKSRETFILVVLLLATATMSTITILRVGSYVRIRRNRIIEPNLNEKDLLVIYHQDDEKEALLTLQLALQSRFRYSCTLRPLQSPDEIGGDDLKVKGNAHKAIMAMMSPSLLAGEWSCRDVHLAIEALIKIHYTVICVFLEVLPTTNTPEDNLLKHSLNKVYFVDRSKKKLTKWESIKLYFPFSGRGRGTLEDLQKLF